MSCTEQYRSGEVFFLFLPFKIYIKKYTKIQYTSKQTKKQKEREKKDKT